MRVITNHVERQFLYRYEVPSAVLASEFDYQDADETTDGFFRYRNTWYHLDGFMYAPPELEALGYNGWAADSFFSGVAIAVSDDGETYRVATVLS